MSQDPETNGLEIAVIGMAGRFPGARSVDELWAKLRDGVDCITFFSEDELVAAGVDRSLVRRPDYIRAAGVLQDADLFDAEFFGFSPREAELLDPQQRLFLECAWEALEHAGYSVETCRALVGVCAGAGRNGYYQQNVVTNPDLVAAAGVFQTVLNNEKDSLALRTAYQLNLGGPSLTVQTACSTSLVAVHVACQNLLAGECDICLAGGVSIALPQTAGYLYAEGMMASPDGHCHAFDATAAGCVLGRGVGVVVLKRLADALADGDAVLAVIKGSAVNNDGSSKIGYSAPSIDGQAKVIQTALLRAGVAADSISFVETHGTGTPLGDPIEIAALNQAFANGAVRPGTCALGAIKTNLGHLDTAAGVAGLIKTVLALRHRQLPPTLHYNTPNPRIDFAAGPFYVNTSLREWSPRGGRRRAGVSSFGMGGANAHVVLEEAPAIERTSIAHSRRLLVLSARSEAALGQATENLSAFLRSASDVDLDDVAFTLQVGRKTFNHRRAIVCGDAADAAAVLADGSGPRRLGATTETRARSIAFMFPGQGAQYAGMARQLFEEYAEFRSGLTECCRLFGRHLPGLDLLKAMHPAAGDAAAAERLAQTDLAQPALFAVEYALARMLMAWGVAPDAMIGHSLGELVAACLAGVFTLEQAVGLIAARGRLMQALPPGGMLAVSMPAEEVAALVAGTPVSVAALNGPRVSVVSGPLDAIDRLEARLADNAVRLRTSHAFHSSMMDPIVGAFGELVAKARPAAPRLRFISNVTGTWITDREATDPAYWANHLRQPVRFGQGIRELAADPRRIVFEVGPGAALATLARQNVQGAAAPLALSTMPRPQDKDTDAAVLLGAVARLWLAGVPIEFEKIHAGDGRRRVALPTYPFERTRFWVEPGVAARAASRPRTLVKASSVDAWCYAPVWKTSTAPSAKSAAQGRWLLFTQRSAAHDAVAARLLADGAEIVCVLPGTRFERSGPGTYVIDPRERAHYDALLRDIGATDRTIDRVAHLWRVGAGDGDAFDSGFFSLLFLMQAIGADRRHQVSQVCVGVSHAQGVTGAERLDAAGAAMLGLCKVIPQEYAGISCSTIDVDPDVHQGDPSRGDDAPARIAGQLVAELAAEAPAPVVAYRGYKRWLPAFDPWPAPVPGATRLRDRGVYLITGGLGRVGLALSQVLAREVSARLVLTSTAPLPPREEWDSVAAGSDIAAERVRAVQALERAGAEVLVHVADLSNSRQVAALVAAAERRFGRIDGVVHAAGVTHGPSFAPLDGLDRAACERQFAPKVAGVRALEAALAGRTLDFCLLTSSLSSVLGGIGFGAYAAANAYMDAVAHEHHAQGESWWVSVNWDGWNFDESAEGAGAALALLPAEGAAAFAHIVAGARAPQAIVSTADLALRLDQARPSSAPAGERRSMPSYARPNLQNAYVAPSSDVERTLAEIWRAVLGVDRVGVDDNFFELGGHSLLAMQTVASLRTAFGRPISVVTMFEHPTIATLALALSGDAATGFDDVGRRAEHRLNRMQQRRRGTLV